MFPVYQRQYDASDRQPSHPLLTDPSTWRASYIRLNGPPSEESEFDEEDESLADLTPTVSRSPSPGYHQPSNATTENGDARHFFSASAGHHLKDVAMTMNPSFSDPRLNEYLKALNKQRLADLVTESSRGLHADAEEPKAKKPKMIGNNAAQLSSTPSEGHHLRNVEMATDPSFSYPGFNKYLSTLDNRALSDLVTELSRGPRTENPKAQNGSENSHQLDMKKRYHSQMDDSNMHGIQVSQQEPRLFHSYKLPVIRSPRPLSPEDTFSGSATQREGGKSSDILGDNRLDSARPPESLAEDSNAIGPGSSELQHRGEINIHGLNREERQILDKFSDIFLTSRADEDPLLYVLLNDRHCKAGAKIGPDFRTTHYPALNDLHDTLDGLSHGKLEQWSNHSEKWLEYYFETAKIAEIGENTDPDFIDQVKAIIDGATDTKLRSLLFLYLDPSKHKRGCYVTTYSQPLSIYSLLERNPEKNRSHIWFPQPPVRGHRVAIATERKHERTVYDLDNIRTALTRLAIKTTKPKTIRTQLPRTRMKHVLACWAKLQPELTDKLSHAMSELDKVTFENKFKVLDPPVAGSSK